MVTIPRPPEPAGADHLLYTIFETPVGTLYVAYAENAVRCSDLAVSEERFVAVCHERTGQRAERESETPGWLRRATVRTLEDGTRFTGPVDLSNLTDFQQRVLRKTMEIRKGEVRPYSWIAREIGAPNAMRAVGTALAINPVPVLIPCHRVVRADARLGQYGCGGTAKKREILAYEGVDVDRLDHLARQGNRFQGSKTTHIFCLPTCYTGRRMKPEHRVLFATVDEAHRAGFRPCKICRPA